MRFVRSLLVFPLIFFVSSFCLRAQKVPVAKQPRILILLDGSSSMIDKWNEKNSRFRTAEQVILTLMDSVYRVNKDVEFALRVFGHQHSVIEKNCYDTRNEVAFSKNNMDQMSLRLNDIKPYGITPIAYSIKRAVEDDMVDEQKYIYSLVLITDGGESCGGDICEVVKTLLEKKIYFKPYIVSLFESASMADAYACMGQYMQVTKSADIGKTVHTIVDAYKPMFRSNTDDLRPLSQIIPIVAEPVVEKVVTPKPAIKPIEKPVVKPIEIPVELPIAKPIEKPVVKPIEKPIVKSIERPVDPPVARPVVKPVIKPERVKEALVDIYPLSAVAITRPIIGKPAFSAVTLPAVTINNPLPRDTMERLAVTGKPRRLSLLFTVPGFKEVPLPAIVWKELKDEPAPQPIVKEEPRPQPVVKEEPKPKPAPKEEPTPAVKPKPSIRPAIAKSEQAKVTEPSYKVETEDAEETIVEVYFTNGKGKFYSSTPQVLFKDVVMGTVAHKFYRTIDADNRPDPQKVLPGKYNVLIAGRGNSMLKNVVVPANKKTKIYITLTNGSLHFRYKDNPERPVSEYTARVSQRSGGMDREQPCDTDIMYEPGSYHITVNTQPVSHFYVDLDMSTITSITLPVPGHIQFTNTNMMNTVSLYTPLGDKYVKFMGVDITGRPESQKIELKPGPYEVRFVQDPKAQGGREKAIPFNVESDKVTELELK